MRVVARCERCTVAILVSRDRHGRARLTRGTAMPHTLSGPVATVRPQTRARSEAARLMDRYCRAAIAAVCLGGVDSARCHAANTARIARRLHPDFTDPPEDERRTREATSAGVLR